MVKKISRREFLKGAAATGAGIYGAAILPYESRAASGSAKSRLVIVNSPNVLVDPTTNTHTLANMGMTSVGSADPSINQSVLNSMISQGMQVFTGVKSEAGDWKKLFKPSDVVGIKINGLFGKGASTRPELVASVIAGLKLAGVKEENIIVWDWKDRHLINCGFQINRNSPGVLCYGTENEFEEQPTTVGSFTGRLSMILTRKITALINMPVLKDHGSTGITCAMKNHYGSHHNPGDHHGNNSDPFIAELNSIPAIRDKTRLIVCDILKPLANGGPGLKPEFIWEHRSILIGTDPVALDYTGWQIIESRRKEIGLPTLTAAGRPPKWIATAASMGLGTNDPARMEIIRKTVTG